MCLPCSSSHRVMDVPPNQTTLETEQWRLSVPLSWVEMFGSFWCQTVSSDLGVFFWIWKQWEVKKYSLRLDIFLMCCETYWAFGYYFYLPLHNFNGKVFSKVAYWWAMKSCFSYAHFKKNNIFIFNAEYSSGCLCTESVVVGKLVDLFCPQLSLINIFLKNLIFLEYEMNLN